MKINKSARSVLGMGTSLIGLIIFGLLLYYVGGAIIGIFGWIIGGIIVYLLFFR